MPRSRLVHPDGPVARRQGRRDVSSLMSTMAEAGTLMASASKEHYTSNRETSEQLQHIKELKAATRGREKLKGRSRRRQKKSRMRKGARRQKLTKPPRPETDWRRR